MLCYTVCTDNEANEAGDVMSEYNRASDLYTMRFHRFSMKTGLKTIRQYDDVYCDMLIDLFEDETGLYLRL